MKITFFEQKKENSSCCYPQTVSSLTKTHMNGIQDFDSCLTSILLVGDSVDLAIGSLSDSLHDVPVLGGISQ